MKKLHFIILAVLLFLFSSQSQAFTENNFVLSDTNDAQEAMHYRRQKTDLLEHYPTSRTTFAEGSTVWTMFTVDFTNTTVTSKKYEWRWFKDNTNVFQINTTISTTNATTDYTVLILDYPNIEAGSWRVEFYGDDSKIHEKTFTVTSTGTIDAGSLVIVFPFDKIMTAGSTTNLSAYTQGAITSEEYTYSTEDSSVATINSSGQITAVAPGQTYIKATGSTTGQWDRCLITVVPDDGVSISLNNTVYRTGDYITMDVFIDGTETIDVYIALVFPDGSFKTLNIDSSLNEFGEVTPLVEDWTITSGMYRALELTIPSDFAGGPYTWYVIGTSPGSDPLDMNNWLTWAAKIFTLDAVQSGDPVITVSPDSGETYTDSISVTITADRTVTIYYTTDGSTPTTASAIYTGPITITTTTILRYLAVDVNDNQTEGAAFYIIE